MYRFLLYIDPGTGSMLFAAMIGIVSTLYFLLQQLWLKVKYRGGNVKADKDRKSLVIFGEGGQYWKVFKPVCDELEARKIDCEYYTMDENDDALKSEYQHVKVSFIGSGNSAFARLNLLNARLCLSTTPGLGVYQWKKSKNVGKYIHIYHAASSGTGYRMFGTDDYDVILAVSSIQEKNVREMEKMRDQKAKEIRIVGCPYLDTLLKRKETFVFPQKKTTTILLAPSWGERSILSRFGSEMIKALIDTGYRIIIRPHPQSFKSEAKMMESLLQQFPAGDLLEWDMSHDNFSSLSRADIMITDYSGIMYDYSLIFERPIIYTETDFDTAPYDAAWFNEAPWHISHLQDIGVQLTKDNFSNIKNMIDDILDDSTFKESISKVKDTIWQCRGSSARNIADYIENELKSSS